MKTDREKLIELIKNGRACPDALAPFDDEYCKRCKYLDDVDCDLSRLADYLIEHGVVIPVRCKDCKHSIKGICNPLKLWCNKRAENVIEIDFCSYGEREEEKINSWKDRMLNTFLGGKT